MARTNVPITQLLANGGVVADPAGTALDPTNGHIIGPGVQSEQSIIRVTNTAGTSKTVTLKAGTDLALTWAAGQGDLTMTVPNGTTRWLGPFESGRYLQNKNDAGTVAGGFLYLDVQSGATGTIAVFTVPRNA